MDFLIGMMMAIAIMVALAPIMFVVVGNATEWVDAKLFNIIADAQEWQKRKGWW
jgi:hypothetical protein